LFLLLKKAKGLGRHLVCFFVITLVGKFGVKKSVLDMFFPFGVYRLMLIGTSRGDSVAGVGFDGSLQFPFLKI